MAGSASGQMSRSCVLIGYQSGQDGIGIFHGGGKALFYISYQGGKITANKIINIKFYWILRQAKWHFTHTCK